MQCGTAVALQFSIADSLTLDLGECPRQSTRQTSCAGNSSMHAVRKTLSSLCVTHAYSQPTFLDYLNQLNERRSLPHLVLDGVVATGRDKPVQHARHNGLESERFLKSNQITLDDRLLDRNVANRWGKNYSRIRHGTKVRAC